MKEIKTAIQKANGKVVLGETTPIKLGLVILILGILVSCVWWAAVISTKLDVVMMSLGSVKDDTKSIKNDVDALKIWKAEIDRSGTRSLDELRKEVMMLREEFRIHSGLNGVKRP